MPMLENLYNASRLNRPIPTHAVQMHSDHWLKGYGYLSTSVLRVTTFKLLATECYRHVDTPRSIPFNSPSRPESKALSPDAVRPLAEGLSILLYFSSPGKYFQIVGYWGLQPCGHFETYTNKFPSASGLE